MKMIKMLRKLPLIASLFLILLQMRNSESLLIQQQSRRAFFIKAATTAATVATSGAGIANAAIDVSGLKVLGDNGTTPGPARGTAPNQPASGPLAGTKLGFKVAGGPRPESEVREIDEARYIAAGKGPSFLVGVPREPSPSDKSNNNNTEKP